MPRIFDNIEEKLLPAIRETIALSYRADFCVGYFNLRGWQTILDQIERWPGGDNNCCRLLIGMQRRQESPTQIDTATALKIKRQTAENFRTQLAAGVPSRADEISLRRLAEQLRSGKVKVKLHLQHTLHAKLYLFFRHDSINPQVGYLGSSNLTFAGLQQQGELNIDVMDRDSCVKLAKWFDERWENRWSLDISLELADIILSGWVRDVPLPPYHIYLKMAYHLCHEARTGISEFAVPEEFNDILLDFQKAAVKIAAHHLNKRGGVLIGDVVGLGKTIMAVAVARMMDEAHGFETLIICPKNLLTMWQDYCRQFHLRAKVLSLSRVTLDLPQIRRFRIVLIDESHNLRNREGKRYRAIHEYIQQNESKCILLSATPYNKDYLDLSNQLRLFVGEETDLGIRPEQLLREIGETEFLRRHQCPVRSLAAFEKSSYTDDWRELMRHYLVRRTRTFIQDNYARIDPKDSRKFLTFSDGSRSYFPNRVPRTITYQMGDGKDDDPYARLYSPEVVDTINALNLPRYGLGNYIQPTPRLTPNGTEAKIMLNLSRAGKRLMGFCRTNLFKRLESSGMAFMLSIERHILRNFVYLYAIENKLEIPIGTQDAAILDSWIFDGDSDMESETFAHLTEEKEEIPRPQPRLAPLRTLADFTNRAATIYRLYADTYKKRFQWLRADLFVPALAQDLERDSHTLFAVILAAGEWNPQLDHKVKRLVDVLQNTHPHHKVLIFSQFADTVSYLHLCLTTAGITRVDAVTGACPNPSALAWAFSPVGSDKRAEISPADELRVLIATDVLSEGQNLQDCAIVINYDLPWAIIRLIQRVGRVDRIGQKAPQILCYSFLPADGVERIIRLRTRIRRRLQENAEVVGTDEEFFEEERQNRMVLDIYNENAGILDNETDGEVDLASYIPIRSGRMPSPRSQLWNKSFPIYNPSSIRPALLRVITGPMVCWFICAPDRKMTHWSGWIKTAPVSPNRKKLF